MRKYIVQYGYDTGDDNDGFVQFWDVLNEEKSFQCSTELEAVELCRILNSHDGIISALKQLVQVVEESGLTVFNREFEAVQAAKAALSEAVD